MRFDKQKIQWLMIPGMAFLLSGCLQQAAPNDPAFAPVAPAKMTPPPNNSGGIYQAGYERSLFEDRRANRVGDMLTIRLVEQTTSSKSAKTAINKENTTSIGVPTIAGQQPGALQNRVGGSNAVQLDSSTEFSGDGSSQQNNNLAGTITVTVANVLPNGYLMVRGEKWITLNRGDEYIRLSGIIRPEDIDSSNMVDSTRVADARITYSGRGEVSDSNAMGWLAKFFTSMIFPF